MEMAEHNAIDYACPLCEWEPPSDGDFYQIANGELIILEFIYNDNGMTRWPKAEYVDRPIYPIITNHHQVDFYEHDWLETHFCPHCGIKFKFWNGT